MKNHFIKVAVLILLAVSSFSCKKDFNDMNINPLADRVADIPVTVTNYDFFERFPIINTSIAAGGKFTIMMQIPVDKGIIKEISKVATGPSAAGSALTNLNSTAALTAYNSTVVGGVRTVQPIAGNNTNQISFTSDLATYLAYRNSQGTAAVQATFGPANTATTPAGLPVPSTNQVPTEIQFYFRITLVDGTVIIPQPVRVRVSL